MSHCLKSLSSTSKLEVSVGELTSGTYGAGWSVIHSQSTPSNHAWFCKQQLIDLHSPLETTLSYLEIVNAILPEPHFGAADESPHEVFSALANFHISGKVEAVLRTI